MVKGQKSKGRQKVEMKRISSEESRQVCFSKRRKGLFNKAHELCILCGAMVGVIVFSISGRAYSIGHPSIDDVINRFLAPNPPNVPATSGGANQDGGGVTATVRQLSEEYTVLQESVEEELKNKESLQEAIDKEMGGRMMQWLTAKISDLGQDDLQEFYKELQAIHDVVLGNVNQVMADARKIPSSQPQPPSMDIATSSQRYQFGEPGSFSQQFQFGEPSLFSQQYQFCEPSSSSQQFQFGESSSSSQQFQFGEPSSSSQQFQFGEPSSSSQQFQFDEPSSSSQQFQFGEPISSSSQQFQFGEPSSSSQQFQFGQPISSSSQQFQFGQPITSSSQQFQFGEPSSQPHPSMDIASSSQYQFGEQSVIPMSVDGPSSTNGFIGEFEVNDPLLSDILGFCDSGNFPNNQNSG